MGNTACLCSEETSRPSSQMQAREKTKSSKKRNEGNSTGNGSANAPTTVGGATNIGSSSMSSSAGAAGGQYYVENVVGELKQKRINPKKFCRPSRIIYEQVSMNQRDTVHSPISLSNASLAMDRFSRRLSIKIQQFKNANTQGELVYRDARVIIRNLKDDAYLLSRYEKLKRHDKQNLVKLDQYRSEANEIYLTWTFQSPLSQQKQPSSNESITTAGNKLQQNQQNQELPDHPKNSSSQLNLQNGSTNGGSDEAQLQKQLKNKKQQQPDQMKIGMKSNDSVLIKHASTSLFLQSNASRLFDPESEVHKAQLVSCGAMNKFTADQEWVIESLDDNADEGVFEQIRVNALFRLKHADTKTYLAQYKKNVLCIEEDMDQNTSSSEFEAVRVSMTSPEFTSKPTPNNDQIDFKSINLADEEIEDDDGDCEEEGKECKQKSKKGRNQEELDKQDEKLKDARAITLLNSLTKSQEEKEIAGLINDEDDDDDEPEIDSNDSMFSPRKPKQGPLDSLFRTGNQGGQNLTKDTKATNTNNNNNHNKTNENNNFGGGERQKGVTQLNMESDVVIDLDQQLLDEQVRNKDYMKNLQTDRQDSEIERVELLKRHRLAFFDKISKGQIWYVSEILPLNSSTITKTNLKQSESDRQGEVSSQNEGDDEYDHDSSSNNNTNNNNNNNSNVNNQCY